MTTRAWAVLGLLLAGTAARGQPPADDLRRAEIARRRARVQLAELDQEVARSHFKEIMLLVRRGERDGRIDARRDELTEKARLTRMESLRRYVKEEQDRFEEREVELERLRQQLAEAMGEAIDRLTRAVEADKALLETMSVALKAYQRSPESVGVGRAETREDKDAAMATLKQRYEQVRSDFERKSEQLKELRRRAAGS